MRYSLFAAAAVAGVAWGGLTLPATAALLNITATLGPSVQTKSMEEVGYSYPYATFRRLMGSTRPLITTRPLTIHRLTTRPWTASNIFPMGTIGAHTSRRPGSNHRRESRRVTARTLDLPRDWVRQGIHARWLHQLV
jgi:hypothetical protein